LLKLGICLITSLFITGFASAQGKRISIKEYDLLVANGCIAELKSIIEKRLPHLLRSYPDSVSNYIQYIGKVAVSEGGVAKAKQALLELKLQLKAQAVPDSSYQKSLITIANLFALYGERTAAYNLLQNLKQETRYIMPKLLFELEYAMGSCMNALLHWEAAAAHYKAAAAAAKKVKPLPYRSLATVYHSSGLLLQNQSVYDSAIYYFNTAKEYLDKAGTEPEYHYDFLAWIENNLGICYEYKGDFTTAITFYKRSVSTRRQHIASLPPGSAYIENAYNNLMIGMANLGTLYYNIGDFSQAVFFLSEAYRQIIKSNDKSVLSFILNAMGAVSKSRYEFTDAIRYSDEAIAVAVTDQQSSFRSLADAYHQKGTIYEKMHLPDSALKYYQLSEYTYNIVIKTDFDDSYLSNLAEQSLFYTRNGRAEQGLNLAMKAIRYLKVKGLLTQMTAVPQLYNLALVHLEKGDIQKSISICDQALHIIDQKLFSAKTLYDSIHLQLYKPGLIVTKTKARYNSLAPKDKPALLHLIRQMNEAVEIIEHHKAIIVDRKDASLFIEANRAVTDFIKELNLELFNLTGEYSFLEAVINTQEATIYNRIHSQLNRQKAIQFGKVPSEILGKEEAIVSSLQAFAGSDNVYGTEWDHYFKTRAEWEELQRKIKNEYPAYYKARYAGNNTFTENTIKHLLPQNITLVRYSIINNQLYALVADKTIFKWIPLPAKDLEKEIFGLAAVHGDPVHFGNLSHRLYRQLWQPLESLVKNKRVILIPDGILYNISFDILTVKPIRNFNELATNALLSRYAFSIQYSLSSMQTIYQKHKTLRNYTAFVPGFLDVDKKAYQQVLEKDSGFVDQQYMLLTPLPFSIQLAQTSKSEFGGTLFPGNISTVKNFIENGDKNVIMHIGTHAESNNQYPEYSRLFFAKNLDAPQEENSVYLHELYNYSLNTDLTVLTACETGKPGFFPGEGMISLAHAFNYAGSRSILTGLWKIDEQSSVAIVKEFYRKLKRGMPKDVALQQAKLNYLQNNKGRLLTPQYWAGLVIIGNTYPILLKNNLCWIYYIIGITAVGAFLIFLFRRKKVAE